MLTGVYRSLLKGLSKPIDGAIQGGGGRWGACRCTRACALGNDGDVWACAGRGRRRWVDGDGVTGRTRRRRANALPHAARRRLCAPPSFPPVVSSRWNRRSAGSSVVVVRIGDSLIGGRAKNADGRTVMLCRGAEIRAAGCPARAASSTRPSRALLLSSTCHIHHALTGNTALLPDMIISRAPQRRTN